MPYAIARFISLPVLLLVACTASTAALRPGAESVQVGKADPDPNQYSEIGPIEVRHGGFGASGTYEGAYAELRNKAAAMNGDYVEIMAMTEPAVALGKHDFVIRATVFRLKQKPPAATAAK